MSLALARTHAPGQPEYVLAHSLWVKRTPTCMSGRGSGRGEVALPAGVGLSKFGVGTGFGGCDNTKPGSRNLSIHACFSSESMISCRRSLVLGSRASTASWTVRMVLTAA